jgi:hypothetical protein
MADVRSVTVDKDERGQLVLVFAMTLAIVFVVLALFLNTAIYTENIATRQSDIAGASDAATYRDEAVRHTERGIRHVNEHHNEDNLALNENITQEVSDWSNLSRPVELRQSASANASRESINQGTRITQIRNRSFTNESGVSDWTLVHDTDHVRDFSLSVKRSSLTDTNTTEPDFGNAFRVTFTDDDDDDWTLHVFRNDTGGDYAGKDTINVVLIEPGGAAYERCQVEAAYLTIDVSAGRIGSEPCPNLNGDSLWNDLSRPITVSFNNTMVGGTETVNGTFNITVSTDSVLDPMGNYELRGSTDGAFRTDAIYSVDLRVTYRTSRVNFDTIIRLAPEELR